jgi:serine/threonine-protein kinase
VGEESRVLGGRYRLEEKIAEGGFGVVYRATQLQLSRTVAVKIVSTKHESAVQEAATLAKLVHANIVTVYDYGETEDGELFIVMEYLEGRLLDEVVHDGPLPLDRVLWLAIQMGRALREAHAKGVVHRDLKPSNVMLVRGPEEGDHDHVKVLDFGLAQLIGAGTDASADQMLAGTPRFMAPEQICGEDTDFRADIYAFGCILYYLLTGAPPFDGDSRFEIVQSHLTRDPRPILQHGFRRDCPAELETIILRCLEKTPDRRPCSVSALVEELKAVYAMLPHAAPLRATSSQDLAKSRSPSLVPMPSSVPTPMLHSEPLRRPGVVRPWWWLAAAFGILAGVSIAVARERSSSPPFEMAFEEEPLAVEQPIEEAIEEPIEKTIEEPIEKIEEPAEAKPELIAAAPREVAAKPKVPPKRAPRPRAKRPIEIEAPVEAVAEVEETPVEPPVVEPPVAPVEPPPVAVIEEPAPVVEQPAPLAVKREPSRSSPLTDVKCGKCHPPSVVFDAIRDGRSTIAGRRYGVPEIERQLVRCMRLPHSGISKGEAREILSILTRYQSEVSR